MKKSFIIVIAALLVVSVSVFAAPNPASDFKVDLNSAGTGVVIQQYLAKTKTVEIPATIEGLPVVEIGKNAFQFASVTSVVLPDSVTKIDFGAFSYCGALTKVTLSKNLIEIGDFAFSSSSAIAAITIPAGVTSIGKSAFRGCDALKTITIPAGVTSIGESAFQRDNALTTITIPAGASVGESAFAECKALTTVTISEGVAIENWAFSQCSNLTNISLPASGVTFKKEAYDPYFTFAGCPKLTLAIKGKLKALGYDGEF
jgi:hypothetical protein